LKFFIIITVLKIVDSWRRAFVLPCAFDKSVCFVMAVSWLS